MITVPVQATENFATPALKKTARITMRGCDVIKSVVFRFGFPPAMWFKPSMFYSSDIWLSEVSGVADCHQTGMALADFNQT